jgi:manganese/zinc/iron transport system ATP- binding protein
MGAHVLLNDLNLRLPSEMFCGIAGPNGSGKTTLLRTLARLRKPDRGDLRWHYPVKLSYLSQTGVPDPDFPISVKEIFESAWLGVPRSKRSVQEMEYMIDLMGFSNRLTMNFGKLSGGLQQRCLLGRTLLRPADVYLLDEPFSALDSATIEGVAPVISEMVSRGKTVFMIHHTLENMLPWFTHLLELDGKGNCVFKENNLSSFAGLSALSR